MNKIVVVSDWHIGWKRAGYDSIRRALDLIEENYKEIDILILNGDIFDLWRCNYKKIRNTPIYNDIFERLQKITNIVRTIYIRGNHDYGADKVIGDDLNVEYTRMFVNNNICYIHGDRFSTLQIESFSALITKRFHFISKFVDRTCIRPNISVNFVKRIEKFKTDNFFEHVIVAHNHISWIYKGIVFCGDSVHYPSYIEVTDEKIKIKKI